jgi:ABC-2 type transport system permease protein
MLALVRGELFKLTHRMMTRVLLLIVFSAPVATYVLLGTTGNSQDGDVLNDYRLETVPDNGMFIIYQLAMMTAIVLTATSVASEFTWGTIRTLLPRSAGRVPFLSAKLAIIGVYLVVAVVLGFLAALTGSAIVTTVKDLDSGTGDNFLGQLGGAMVRTGYAVLPYVAMAFLVSLWSRSSAVGIAVPIVVFYAEVLLTPAFTSAEALEWLPNALLYSANISSLVDSDAVLAKEDLPNYPQAAGVLAVYIAAFISLAYARFLTRDVT